MLQNQAMSKRRRIDQTGLAMDILKHGAAVEVIAPEALRQSIR